jgi:hypothetical protein
LLLVPLSDLSFMPPTGRHSLAACKQFVRSNVGVRIAASERALRKQRPCKRWLRLLPAKNNNCRENHPGGVCVCVCACSRFLCFRVRERVCAQTSYVVVCLHACPMYVAMLL